MKFLLFCSFLLSSLLVLSQAPTADFTATPLSVCIGDPINFTDASTAGGSPIVLWSWDFGDGNSANTTNTSHIYTAPGTYTITLVVTDQNSLADAEVKVSYVTVNPLPVVAFTSSGNGCTVPFDVTFTNNSATGANISYAWDFGNGQTSTVQSPGAVTYNAAGTYTVSLTVTNSTTGCVNTSSQDIVVSDFNTDFTAPPSACVGETIDFQDLSTVGVNSWAWAFGDGQTSATQNPTISYNTAGTYDVTLTSQNTSFSCSDVITQSITIFALPVPAFTADVLTGCSPLDVIFTNTNPGGTNYDWDFGNGSTFNGENPPTQTYNSDGSFTVSLTMTDANGCTGTTSIANYIVTSPPIVDFTADVTSGCDPLIVQFTDNSTSSNPIDDPIVNWTWDFGDGSPVFNGEVPPPHSYGVGVFSVTLTITTLEGCQETITLTDYIEVGSISFVDFLVAPTIECAKTDIFFTDLTVFNGVPDPADVTYDWDFGDGGTSTEQDPTYQYPSDTGYFDVTLVVDWRGCKDTLVMVEAVYILAPISLFSPVSTLFCNPASFPVNVAVTDDAIIGESPDDVFMIWDWGDGTFTNFDDPDLYDADQGSTSHDYGAYGSYTIEQVIHNFTTGCSDSTTAVIHISETVADFVISNDSACVNSPITLTSTSTSTHSFGTFSFDMGNGSTATGSPTNFSYPASGAFNITLTATNSVGCADTEVFIGMDALALPVASIVAAETGCAPLLLTYGNGSSSVGNGVPLASFVWTMPDLSVQNTTNVATTVDYLFTTEGSFTTTLVATDEFGCVSLPTTSVMTITKPTADFTMDPVVCDEEVFSTTNNSTGVPVISYEWFVDGASMSNTNNLTTSFDEVSNPSINNVPHDIMLIVTDGNGCKDTLEQEIIVSMPYADLIYSFSGANINSAGEFTCPPVFADLTDNSSSFGNITNFAWDFGDGKFSTLQDPGNTYVFAGTYTLQFSITDEFGCTSDTTLLDYLTIFGPSAVPSWTSGLDACGQNNIFSINSMVNVDLVVWDLGDGNTSTDSMDFVHSYQNSGTYDPSVTIQDELGCEVIYTLPPITVSDNGLNAQFSANPEIGSPFKPVTFYDESTSSGAPIVNWEWNIDGTIINSITGSNQSFSFSMPGSYIVTLVVTNSDGCADSYTLEIIIDDKFELPNVFTPNGDGTNDYFTLSADFFDSYDIVILNRWGEVMHERNQTKGSILWDGLNKIGVEAVDGVYFYLFTGYFVNGESVTKHGNVTLLRGK